MEALESDHRLLEPAASHEHYSSDDAHRGSSTPTLNERHFNHVQRLLYVSHFLSTWNSRLFEFGAYLFLANIYPQTLLPASVYALTRASSAAIVTPWLGQYVDTGDRLAVVRTSIGKQLFALRRTS